MKNNRIKLFGFGLSLVVLSITGCNPENKWQQQEEQQIQDYLYSIGDTVYTKKPSGLYYLDLVVGTGTSPVVDDTIAVKYKGTFLTGQIFGSNYGDTAKLKWIVGTGSIITGLDEGVRYMKAGGKAKMLLPSSLAYGKYGYGTIPGYSPLLFTVELVEVKAH